MRGGRGGARGGRGKREPQLTEKEKQEELLAFEDYAMYVVQAINDTIHSHKPVDDDDDVKPVRAHKSTN